ncbi:MAG: DUF488 family protein [Thermodesulfovibrionales bacterium]
MQKEKIVYTLGTDRRSEEDFIEILNFHGIECVIDVRRFPTSKLSHFRKESFEAFLKADGIRYSSAIVCAEKFPWKCHRRWIARALRKKGWKVIHIIEKDRVWIPE